LTAQAPDSEWTLTTTSPDHTMRTGEALGRLLPPGSVVCLRGNLGSGKTRLTQGIGRGLGVCGAIHSPTFVFINEHPPCTSGPCLYHVDLYRIHDEADVLALGLEEYMYGDGVTVIEWAERAEELMPPDCLWVTLRYVDEHTRDLTFQAGGPAYTRLLARLRQDLGDAPGAEGAAPATDGAA